MCEDVLAHLVSGAPLSEQARAHAAGCPRCRAAITATKARSPRTPRAAPPAPTPTRLRAQARQRATNRVAATVAALALIAASFAALRPTEPTGMAAVEPDVLGLLAEVDALAATEIADPPGTEALALLDPLGDGAPDPFADDLFFSDLDL